MIRIFLLSLIVFLFSSFTGAVNKQNTQSAFKAGEFLKFKISYSKFIGAGYATLELSETIHEGKSVYFAKGFGTNTGLSKIFFKVEDHYHSYFDKENTKPYLAVRNIREGSYTQNQKAYFDRSENKVLLKNLKTNKEKTIEVPKNVQDVVSTFYYLRNHKDIDKIEPGQSIEVDMFFDDEVFKFKLKYLGKENIKTKFGKVSAMIFRPLVQAGRVFKEQESLTVWISDDKNKAPLKIKASLAVGSIIAELHEYKGLQYPLNKQ